MKILKIPEVVIFYAEKVPKNWFSISKDAKNFASVSISQKIFVQKQGKDFALERIFQELVLEFQQAVGQDTEFSKTSNFYSYPKNANPFNTISRMRFKLLRSTYWTFYEIPRKQACQYDYYAKGRHHYQNKIVNILIGFPERFLIEVEKAELGTEMKKTDAGS